MVMSKRVFDALPKPEPPETISKWHNKNGTLTSEGTAMYDHIYEYLDGCGLNLSYSQIRDALVARFPNEYTANPGNVNILDKDGKVQGQRRLISNVDIKIIVTELVKDGLVVD